MSFRLSDEQVERWGRAICDAGFGFHGPRFIKSAVEAFVAEYDKLPNRPRPALRDLEVRLRLRRRRKARKP